MNDRKLTYFLQFEHLVLDGLRSLTWRLVLYSSHGEVLVIFCFDVFVQERC